MSYNPLPTVAISSRKIARNYTNGSGSTVSKGVLMSTLSNGNVIPVDVSNLVSADSIVGFYNQATPSAASGSVIDSGILENITTSYVVGTPVYIDTTGNLTNIAPSVGINGFLSGYSVIFAGILVKNEFNPAWIDLKILIQKVGTL